MLYVNKKMSRLDLIRMVNDDKHFSEVEQAEAMLALKKWHSYSARDISLQYYTTSLDFIQMMLRLASLSDSVKMRIGRKSWCWQIISFRKANPKATTDEIIAEIDRLEHWNGSLQEWGRSQYEFKQASNEQIYNDIAASIAAIRAISKGNWKVDNEVAAIIPLLLKEVLDFYKKKKISEKEVRHWMIKENRKLAEDSELDLICRRNFCIPLDKNVDLTDSSLKMKICRDAVAKTLYRTKLQLNEYGTRMLYECNSGKIDLNDVVEACLILADKAMEAISEVF